MKITSFYLGTRMECRQLRAGNQSRYVGDRRFQKGFKPLPIPSIMAYGGC